MRKNIIIRTIAAILVVAFIFQDVVWANPEICQPKQSMQVPNFFVFFKHVNPLRTAIQEILLSTPDIREYKYHIVKKSKNSDVYIDMDFYSQFKEGDNIVIPCSMTILSRQSCKLFYAVIDPEKKELVDLRKPWEKTKIAAEEKPVPAKETSRHPVFVPDSTVTTSDTSKEGQTPAIEPSREGFKMRLLSVAIATALTCVVIGMIYLLGGLEWYIRIKNSVPKGVLAYWPAATLDIITGILIWGSSDVAGQYLNQGKKIRFKQSLIVGLSGIFQGLGTHVLFNSIELMPIFSFGLFQMLLRTFATLVGGLVITVIFARATSFGRKILHVPDYTPKKERQKTGDVILSRLIIAPTKTFIVINLLPEWMRVATSTIWDYLMVIFSAYLMNRNEPIFIKYLERLRGRWAGLKNRNSRRAGFAMLPFSVKDEADPELPAHEKIRMLRIKKGWTQLEFAEKLFEAGLRFDTEESDARRSAVAQWERGVVPSPDKREIIERVLGETGIFLKIERPIKSRPDYADKGRLLQKEKDAIDIIKFLIEDGFLSRDEFEDILQNIKYKRARINKTYKNNMREVFFGRKAVQDIHPIGRRWFIVLSNSKRIRAKIKYIEINLQYIPEANDLRRIIGLRYGLAKEKKPLRKMEIAKLFDNRDEYVSVRMAAALSLMKTLISDDKEGAIRQLEDIKSALRGVRRWLSAAAKADMEKEIDGIIGMLREIEFSAFGLLSDSERTGRYRHYEQRHTGFTIFQILAKITEGKDWPLLLAVIRKIEEANISNGVESRLLFDDSKRALFGAAKATIFERARSESPKPRLAPKYAIAGMAAGIAASLPLCVSMGWFGFMIAPAVSLGIFTIGWGIHEFGHWMGGDFGKTNVKEMRAGPMASAVLFAMASIAGIVSAYFYPNTSIFNIPLAFILTSAAANYAFHIFADEGALFTVPEKETDVSSKAVVADPAGGKDGLYIEVKINQKIAEGLPTVKTIAGEMRTILAPIVKDNPKNKHLQSILFRTSAILTYLEELRDCAEERIKTGIPMSKAELWKYWYLLDASIYGIQIDGLGMVKNKRDIWSKAEYEEIRKAFIGSFEETLEVLNNIVGCIEMEKGFVNNKIYDFPGGPDRHEVYKILNDQKAAIANLFSRKTGRASWLYGSVNVNIQMVAEMDYFGRSVINVYPVFGRDEFAKYDAVMKKGFSNYPGIMHGSIGRLLVVPAVVDGEAVLVVKEIQTTEGFRSRLPEDVRKRYDARWALEAVKFLASIAREAGMNKFYGCSEIGIGEIGGIVIPDKRKLYKESYRGWDKPRSHLTAGIIHSYGDSNEIGVHSLYACSTQKAELLSNYNDYGPQLKGLADFYPAVEGGAQAVEKDRKVYVTVDFDRPADTGKLRCVLHYGIPGEKAGGRDRQKMWQDMEGELINTYERSYRFRFSLPRGMDGKEYTLKVSYDGGQTWGWMGRNIKTKEVNGAAEGRSPEPVEGGMARSETKLPPEASGEIPLDMFKKTIEEAMTDARLEEIGRLIIVECELGKKNPADIMDSLKKFAGSNAELIEKVEKITNMVLREVEHRITLMRESSSYLARSGITDWDNPAIIAKAKEIVGDETDDYRKAEKIFSWIDDNIVYAFDLNWDAPASEVLEAGYGHCGNITNLTVAMLRAVNVPCRIRVEWIDKEVFRGFADESLFAQIGSLRGGQTKHSLAEALIGGEWHMLDLLTNSAIAVRKGIRKGIAREEVMTTFDGWLLENPSSMNSPDERKKLTRRLYEHSFPDWDGEYRCISTIRELNILPLKASVANVITAEERELIERVGIAIRSMAHDSDMDLLSDLGEIRLLGDLVRASENMFDDVFEPFKEMVDKSRIAIDPVSNASKMGCLTKRDADAAITALEELLVKLKDLRYDVERKIREFLSSRAGNNTKEEESEEVVDAIDKLKYISIHLDQAIGKLESRLEIAKGTTSLAAVNLHELLSAICEKINKKEKGIKITMHREGSAKILVNGNLLSLRTAIENIVKNAASFAKKKESETKIPAEVKINLKREGELACVEIMDNGPGIPTDSKLLEPDSVTKRLKIFNLNVSERDGGTGLGTTEAWYVVNDYGGNIGLDSVYGKGTTFTIKLPLIQQDVRRIRFVKNINLPQEASQNLIDEIKSYLVSGKKLVLAFDKKMRDHQYSRLISHLERWRDGVVRKNPALKNVMNNLIFIDFNSRDDLSNSLEDKGFDINDRGNTTVFVFAPVSERKNLAGLCAAARCVFVQENESFSDTYYYPLLEMVVIALAREFMDYSIGDIDAIFNDFGIDANEMNIGKIEEDDAYSLIFTIIPNITRYNSQEQVDRFTRMLRFIESA